MIVRSIMRTEGDVFGNAYAHPKLMKKGAQLFIEIVSTSIQIWDILACARIYLLSIQPKTLNCYYKSG